MSKTPRTTPGIPTRNRARVDDLTILASPNEVGGSKIIHSPPASTTTSTVTTVPDSGQTSTSLSTSVPSPLTINPQITSKSNMGGILANQNKDDTRIGSVSTDNVLVLAQVEARIDNLTSQLQIQSQMGNANVDAINRLTEAVNQLILRDQNIVTTCENRSATVSAVQDGIRVGGDHTVDPSGHSLGGGGMKVGEDTSPRLLTRNTVTRTSDRRWKDVLDQLKLWPLRFPSQDLSANDFISAVEARAFREGWSGNEILRIMSYLLQDRASRWFDCNFTRWESYSQFKIEFLRAFGSTKTDHQILLEIGQLKPKDGEKMSDFAFRMQSKYQSMKTPPAEHEQVTIIRDHLTKEIRNLVFARPVTTYENLLGAIHEAVQTLEEGKRVFGKENRDEESKISRNRERSRFAALQKLPRAEFYAKPNKNRQPLIIEEVQEGQDGEYVVCATTEGTDRAWQGGGKV